MRIGTPLSFGEATSTAGDVRLVIADASGGDYRPAGGGTVRALVGPEGGWTEGEMSAAREAGAQVVGLGPHVMRIETAAVVLCAMIVRAEAAR